MDRFLTKLLMLILISNLLYACSSSDDSVSGFDLAKAETLWNTVDKSWSNSELRSLESGRAVYKINCAGCHGKDGRGDSTIGAPSLINNAIIKGEINYHIALIKNGKRLMPAFLQALTLDEITNVAIFERNAWGNQDYQVFDKALK